MEMTVQDKISAQWGQHSAMASLDSPFGGDKGREGAADL